MKQLTVHQSMLGQFLLEMPKKALLEVSLYAICMHHTSFLWSTVYDSATCVSKRCEGGESVIQLTLHTEGMTRHFYYTRSETQKQRLQQEGKYVIVTAFAGIA